MNAFFAFPLFMVTYVGQQY